MGRLNRVLRGVYNLGLRARLKNRTFTLISSNCTGGSMLHDLGLRFNTPFIGLFIGPGDYIKLCGNLEHYLGCELTFPEDAGAGKSYPVGRLDDVTVHFLHYASRQEAKASWDARCKRVNFQDLFFLFTDRGGCTYDMLKAFDALPYEHKAVLCNREYPEIKSARYIPGFEAHACVGVCLEYKNRITYQRHYDAFDFVSWFNGEL